MSGICSWLFAAKAENNQLRGISGLVSRLYLGSISPCGPVYPHDKKICNAFNKPQGWACLPMTNRHLIIERTELHGKLDT